MSHATLHRRLTWQEAYIGISKAKVMVKYDKHHARIPRGKYVDNAYQPPYDELPTLEKYNEAQDEKCLASSRISLDTSNGIDGAGRN